MSNRSGGHSAPHYNSSSTGTDGRAFQPSSHSRSKQQATATPPPAAVQTKHTSIPADQPSTDSQPTDEVDNPRPSEEPSSNSDDDSQSQNPLKSPPPKDHGSTFDITLRPPEPSTTSLNQQFEISFHQ